MINGDSKPDNAPAYYDALKWLHENGVISISTGIPKFNPNVVSYLNSRLIGVSLYISPSTLISSAGLPLSTAKTYLDIFAANGGWYYSFY